METSFSWERGMPEPAVECYSDDPAWKFKLLRLAEEHPDQVIVKVRPEENDGAVIVKVPSNYVKIGPPRRVNMTDERKAELAEKMRNLNRSARAEAGE